MLFMVFLLNVLRTLHGGDACRAVHASRWCAFPPWQPCDPKQACACNYRALPDRRGLAWTGMSLAVVI
jgi:hypothetical protein